jgi:hypothetical protein
MRTALILLLAGLAPAALAQDLPQTIAGDIDGDGVPDRVEVRRDAANPDRVDVAIALSASRRTVRVSPLIAATELLTSGVEKGELTLAFNWTQGRYKSSSTFIVGMQGRELVVRRYETSVLDTIRNGKDDGMLEKDCKADFVANRATVDGQPAAPPGPPVAFAAWKEYDSVPKACQPLF